MLEQFKLTHQAENKYSDSAMAEVKDLLEKRTSEKQTKENSEKEEKNKEENKKGSIKKLREVWGDILKHESPEEREQRKKEEEKWEKEYNKADPKKRKKLEETIKQNLEERDDDERVRRAETALGFKFSEKQKNGLIQAHHVGERKESGYSFSEIAEKILILHASDFTPFQILKLLRLGLAGDPPPTLDPAPQPDPPPGIDPSIGGTSTLDEFMRRMERRDEDQRREIADLRRQLTEVRGDGGQRGDEVIAETPTRRSESTTEGDVDLSGYPPELQEELRRGLQEQASITGEEQERPLNTSSVFSDLIENIYDLTPSQTQELQSVLQNREGNEFWGELNRLFDLPENKRSFRDDEIPSINRALSSRAERVNDLLSNNEFNKAKREALKAIRYAQNRTGTVETRRIDVNSIEQLAELIIQTDPELWGEKFPIIDEDGNINQENFLNWIRERMIWHHENDSDNTQQFMGLIEVSTPYQRINLNTMLSQRGKYFRTRDGIDLDELREQVTREVWLYNTSRNDDIEYKAVMHSGDDLNSKIKQRFYFNTFTKNAFGKSTLRWIMTMPEKFIPTLSQQTDPNEQVGQADARIGEAVRTAYLTYYHLSDLEKLTDMLGNDAALLSRDAYVDYIINQEVGLVKARFRDAGEDVTEETELEARNMSTDTPYLAASRERLNEVTEIMRDLNSQESKELQQRWLGSTEGGKPFHLNQLFNSDGTIIKDKFIGFMNFFTGPETNAQNIAVVREMIRKSLIQIYYPGVAEKDLPEIATTYFGMPQYAEQWAFSMLRWSGAAARNDTGARSYDKWTELQLTQFKRERDSSPGRASGYGNPYNIGLYKALSPSLFNGIVLQDDKETSPYQLLEAVEQKRKNREEYDVHNELGRLELTQNAMNQFAAVHLDNTFKLLDIITGAEELDFDKFISYDRYGRMVFSEKDFQEELKSFFKTWRNAYSTWGQINFAQKVRVMPERGSEEYKTVTLAEMMFGDEIIKIPEFTNSEGKFDANLINGKARSGMDGKEVLWKQLVKGYIAAQIRAHRDLHGPYTHYDFGMIEGIYQTLEKVPGALQLLDDDKKRDISISEVRLDYEDGAFSKEDIRWIRKHSGTGEAKMYAQALGTDAFIGGVKGGYNFIKTLFSEALK